MKSSWNTIKISSVLHMCHAQWWNYQGCTGRDCDWVLASCHCRGGGAKSTGRGFTEEHVKGSHCRTWGATAAGNAAWGRHCSLHWVGCPTPASGSPAASASYKIRCVLFTARCPLHQNFFAFVLHIEIWGSLVLSLHWLVNSWFMVGTPCKATLILKLHYS